MGGGKVIKKNNAFTLIELLAIIVILAIIAVITIPILLNVIENSRKGAATDSAYGFKDSINKYYITKLSNDRQFQLEGEYNFSNGKLTGDTINTSGGDTISISGTVPSSAKLHYTNNVLDGGCVVIGDYKVTFGTDGKVDETVKGDCSSYTFSSATSETSQDEVGDDNGGESGSSAPTIAEMCPNCKFIQSHLGHYYDEQFELNEEWETTPQTDYTLLGENYFTGFILNDNNEVSRGFVCGIEKGNAFCLEGGDTSKYSNNIDILNSFFDDEECNEVSFNDSVYLAYECIGSSVGAEVLHDENNASIGTVKIFPISHQDECTADEDEFFCGT